MKRFFSTYFDENYLTRGIALHESLSRRCPDFTLYVLCLSELCFHTLKQLNLPGVVPIDLQELEAADSELLASKQTRSRIEYYFTCTPAFQRYLFRRFSEIDLLTYVDADLYFFGSPEIVFELMRGSSIGIVPHRFAPDLAHLVEHGIYNVGLLVFRRDASGLACIEQWRSQCIDWCYDRVENGRFADQGYLDAWPGTYAGVHVFASPGIGLAPWNMKQYRFESAADGVIVEGHPLVFFHYHGFRRVGSWWYEPGLRGYQTRFTRFFKRHIFRPYAEALSRAAKLAGSSGVSGIARRAYNRHPLLAALDVLRGRLLFFPGEG